MNKIELIDFFIKELETLNEENKNIIDFSLEENRTKMAMIGAKLDLIMKLQLLIK